MAMRDERRKEAARHISLMKAVFASETKQSAENVRIFEDGEGRELDIPEARFESTTTKVMTGSPVHALYSLKSTAVVIDAASFTKPAAGFEDGSGSQESMLCSESNLFGILTEQKKDYYDKNKQSVRGMLFTDRAMLVPDVRFTHNKEMKNADVVVIAAPNRARALENNRGPEECDADLARRIEAAMRIAAISGKDGFVMNAFGCGFAGNDTAAVIDLIAAWLDAHPGVFETVVFSVPRGDIFEAFQHRFDPPQVVEQPAQDEEEEEEDNFDLSDLPEGITLR